MRMVGSYDCDCTAAARGRRNSITPSHVPTTTLAPWVLLPFVVDYDRVMSNPNTEPG